MAPALTLYLTPTESAIPAEPSGEKYSSSWWWQRSVQTRTDTLMAEARISLSFLTGSKSRCLQACGACQALTTQRLQTPELLHSQADPVSRLLANPRYLQAAPSLVLFGHSHPLWTGQWVRQGNEKASGLSPTICPTVSSLYISLAAAPPSPPVVPLSSIFKGAPKLRFRFPYPQVSHAHTNPKRPGPSTLPICLSTKILLSPVLSEERN